MEKNLSGGTKKCFENSFTRFDCKSLYTYEYLKPSKIVDKIELNEKEKQIFSIIKGILNKHNKRTVCRVAGGWVRDKLLDRDNQDVDIALDDMTGEQLAKLINDEIYPGQEKFGVVGQNCDKSKHLETATMKICETFIDFVNLRSEKYTELSRVPIVDIGTPEEDARRRDITINAMFYNINTDTVEDFLGSSFKDLADGYIRTPLDPEITFADDPLRILRVIRFAVRFQFKIDSLIPHAAIKPEIKSALYKKISNERIAKELTLMLEGNKPQCAVYLLYKFNLLDAIMKLPLGITQLQEEQQIQTIKGVNLVLIGSLITETARFSDDECFFNKFLFKTANLKENKKLFFLNLLTLPFRNYTTKIHKETLRASVAIIRDSLKLPNDYVREIQVVHDNIKMMSDYIKLSDGNFDRLSSTKVVRQVKSNYLPKLAVVCVCSDYLELLGEKSQHILEYIDENILFQNIISKYQTWFDYLERENLFYVDNLEPLIKGNKIVEIVGVAGKDIRILIEALIEENVINPNFTQEEAVEFLKRKKEELGLKTVAATKKKK